MSDVKQYLQAMVVDEETGKPMPKVKISNETTTTTGPNAEALSSYLQAMVIDEETGKPMPKVFMIGAGGGEAEPGPAGADGESAYLHLAYATNSTGTAGFSTTTATGKTHVGFHVSNSPTAPTAATSYKWGQFQGPAGAKGETGATGPEGPAGPAPTKVTGDIVIYESDNFTGTGNFAYFGVGGAKCVYINLSLVNALTAGTPISIGTLYSNVRPSFEYKQVFATVGGNHILVTALTTGGITFTPIEEIPASDSVNIVMTFI